MPKIKPGALLKDLQEGMTNKAAAEKHGVSEPTIHYWKRQFKKQGKLQGKSDGHKDLDSAIKEWTEILSKAKRTDKLEEENNTLRNQLATTRNALKICENDLKELADKRQQFRLAQRQGELAHS